MVQYSSYGGVFRRATFSAEILSEALQKRRASEYESEQRSYLKSIINRWAYMFVGSQIIFVKHDPIPGSSRHLRQIILSGDPHYDGIFRVSSYHLRPFFDRRSQTETIRMEILRYDPMFGSDSKHERIELTDLVQKLIHGRFITDEEVRFVLKSIEVYRRFQKKPNIPEIILDIPVGY